VLLGAATAEPAHAATNAAETMINLNSISLSPLCETQPDPDLPGLSPL
jgi:hypothetical protein